MEINSYWINKNEVEERLLKLEGFINFCKNNINEYNDKQYNFFFEILNEDEKFQYIINNNYWIFFGYLSVEFINNNSFISIIDRKLEDEFISKANIPAGINSNNLDNRLKKINNLFFN